LYKEKDVHIFIYGHASFTYPNIIDKRRVKGLNPAITIGRNETRDDMRVVFSIHSDMPQDQVRPIDIKMVVVLDYDAVHRPFDL
jgi:hypothetical protein